VEIVTFNYAEIQKVKSSFEFKNLILSTRNCNEFRFFEPRFTSLLAMCVMHTHTITGTYHTYSWFFCHVTSTYSNFTLPY